MNEGLLYKDGVGGVPGISKRRVKEVLRKTADYHRQMHFEDGVSSRLLPKEILDYIRDVEERLGIDDINLKSPESGE